MFKPPLVPPSSVYADKLSCVCLGYPLWYPEPDDKIGEVQIGDVGYVSDGAFTRLFNVRADVPPVTFWPKTFENPEPLAKEFLMIDPRPKSLVPGCYRSHGVEETHVEAAGKVNVGPGAQAGLAFGYECREDSGAMVCLRHEAVRQDVIDNRHIREYILRHHDAWCSFAIGEIGLRVEPHHIVLVSGWVKTTDHWTATSFMSATSGFHASLAGDAGGAGSLSVEYRKKYSSSGLKISRRGVSYDKREESEAGPSHDQCIFLRRYMVKKRLFLPSKIEAAAEPGLPDVERREDDNDNHAENVNEVVMDPDIIDQVNTPLENLVEYMLESSGAEVAIACDADIDLLFPDYDVFRSPRESSEATNRKASATLSEDSSLQNVPPRSKIDGEELLADFLDPNAIRNHLVSLTREDRIKLLDRLGLLSRDKEAWLHYERRAMENVHRPVSDPETTQTEKLPMVEVYKPPLNEKKVLSTVKQDVANKRPSCIRCTQLKVRCEPLPTDPEVCRRCYRSSQECCFPGRKGKRTLSETALVDQIRDEINSMKTLMVELEQDDNYLSLVWRARQSKTPSAVPSIPIKSTSKYRAPRRKMDSLYPEGVEEDSVPSFNLSFFQDPSSMLDTVVVEPRPDDPFIVCRGILSAEEAKSLIHIYWDYMNPSLGLLDPILYTTEYLMKQSPFLFTVICGTASRFYGKRPDLYQKAMRYAQRAAGFACIGGEKSVDVVYAYILLALYPAPSSRWEDDRSWIYLGVAIRMAIDLNLHYSQMVTPKDEMHARLMLNRTRAWLTCFNLDRFLGIQHGKSPTISSTDFVATRSADWWRSSKYNMKGFDISLSCHTTNMIILGRFREKIHNDHSNPVGLNESLNIADIASKADEELAATWNEWEARLREHADRNNHQHTLRTGILRLAYRYARMTALSFGFQYACDKNMAGVDVDLLHRCLRVANDVIATVSHNLTRSEHKIFLRHGSDVQSAFVTHVSIFLIKLLQPRYSKYLNETRCKDIRGKVRKIADLLGSPEVAVGGPHSPKLYSRFLQGLLEKQQSTLDQLPVSAQEELVETKFESPRMQEEVVDSNMDSVIEDEVVGVSPAGLYAVGSGWFVE